MTNDDRPTPPEPPEPTDWVSVPPPDGDCYTWDYGDELVAFAGRDDSSLHYRLDSPDDPLVRMSEVEKAVQIAVVRKNNREKPSDAFIVSNTITYLRDQRRSGAEGEGG